MNNLFGFLLTVGMITTCSAIEAETPFKSIKLKVDRQRWWVAHELFSCNQQQTISGKVTFGDMPMTGVLVHVKGKPQQTITDIDGNYAIAADPEDTLVFSYTGFKTVSITVGNQTKISVKMEEDDNLLQEVTVNAGYYTVKDKERTGSIAKINAKEIDKQPVSNMLATLQGRMAGVNVTQDTGVPGGGFYIAIRGQNSVRRNGNDPLFVIDGVPYASETIGSSVTSPALSQPTSPLNSINPADIESIEVLKDADATAIYGSRGANGVVLVTTKKGKAGKTRFSANYSHGLGRVTRFRKLMNTEQYLKMRREGFVNDGLTEYDFDDYDVNGTWDQGRYIDWQKELIGGTAELQTVQTSLSGGSVQTQFLLSGNYTRQTTVYPGDFEYKKMNAHLNVNHASDNKKFKITFSGSYTKQDNDQPSADFTRDAFTLAPNAPALFDANGNLNWENNTFNNPMGYLETSNLSKTFDLIANTTISYQLLEGLEARSSFGYSDLHHAEYNAQPSSMYIPSYGLGTEASTLFTTKTNRKSWIIEPQLNYKYTIGKAKIDALAGGTLQQEDADQVGDMAYGFSSNSLIWNPGSAANFLILSSNQSVYKYQAYFGRVNLNWDELYIVNLTGRRDGSSRFGDNNRFAYFGAVGAAWIFSNEVFLKKQNVLSFGKLRGSYGSSGNDQIGDYQYLDTYRTSGSIYQGVSGVMPTRLYNPDFSWERNKKLEFALETGFLNDRIFTTVAWYRNRSSSQLVGIPLPGTTGFSSIQSNLDAEVQNSGWEFGLRTVNLKTPKFEWSTSFNLTSLHNELLSFPDLERSTYKDQLVIGEPLNIVKVYHYTGLNPETGIYEFEDVNGDGKLSAADDKKTVKDLNAVYYGGLQNQLRYRAVQLDFLFQFVKQQNYNQNYSSGIPGTMVNQPIEVMEHWQNDGDTGPYQVYTSGANGAAITASNNYVNSDAAISDASYIRLKNVSLSFDFPKAWTKFVQCRLSVQGQNLLTITSFEGADPEFRSPGFLPPLKMFTTSLQLTF